MDTHNRLELQHVESIEAIYAFIPDLHEKIFTHLCREAWFHCETDRMQLSDYRFLLELPAVAAFYGYKLELGFTLQKRFLDSMENRDLDQKQPQKYAYNPMVAELYSRGHSIRRIAKELGMSKANVEHALREYRTMPHQMLFPFYYDVAIDMLGSELPSNVDSN
jgi:hypothetical protein